MSKADDFYLVDLRFDGDFVAAPNGDFQTIAGLNNLKQALFNRLVTVPGSLAHRPGYGVGAKLYQNAVASLDKQKQLAIRIKEQFEQDFRVEKVTGVSFTQQPQGFFLVVYRVVARGIGEISGTFNPFGDISV